MENVASASSYVHQHQQPAMLPQSVELLITRICAEQNQKPLSTDTRSLLASLGEEASLGILEYISRQKITKSFDGYIRFLSKAKHDFDASSPIKRLCLSPRQHQHQQHSQSRSPLTPTRLVMSPSDSTMRAQGPKNREASTSRPLLEALGELEFRKAFLLLSYSGGRRLEEVITADEIREMKHLPMSMFEEEAWKAVGKKCSYIPEQECRKPCNWDSGQTHIYHAHVYSDGSYKFKGPYLTKMRNYLQRALGDDNILLVKFVEEETDERNTLSGSCDFYAKFSNVVRQGIDVGLRRYRFFVFKDGGKEEKKKDPTSSQVKCYFARFESSASADSPDYVLSGKTVREGRSLIMHAENLASLSNYMARFSLILSKTFSPDIDLSTVTIERIEDIRCRDKDGNDLYDKDGKPLIQTDGTGFISEDLALQCPKDIHKESCKGAENVEELLGSDSLKGKFSEMKFPGSSFSEPPLLIQFRLFNNGSAVKGTLLVNKKLPPRTIHVRPSMIKVQTDEKLSDTCIRNSLEVVNTSNRPKKAYLSRNLIALLSYGGVPDEVFLGLLDDALEDGRGGPSHGLAALQVALQHGEIDDFIVARMILSGIPLQETCLQHRLSFLLKTERKSLKTGRIPVPESYYLIGTTDPSGLLETDEVCVILENGQISGKVLVYRQPGLHFGDVHILNAKYVEALEDFVGNCKYAIFFPCKGPRSLADEMAGGDYDGDMYFVSRNPQLLATFKQSEPWTSSSLAHTLSSKKPSEFSDEELENELFKLFLRLRFHPSYTMGMAADSWMAVMDRLLSLPDDNSDEKFLMKENICRLIDIYYDALDAPKNGTEIKLPKDLQAELYPHYMEKGEGRQYMSKSVLGLIYDKVKKHEDEELSTKEIRKLPCFDVEVPDLCRVKWEGLYDQYRRDMTNALSRRGNKQAQNEAADAVIKKYKKTKNEAADAVIKKYKEILYEAPEFDRSQRTREEIFDEARAIYQVAYSYALRKGDVEKCGFAWKVAGPALCTLYIIEQQREPPVACSLSALKQILC